ncbi:MAG: hypothetical protein JRH08_00865 [Deltaproteobacteria bacterium]|nr:hypothetical protein [Deltaproteobacteria bacterium]MBW2025714.1 hypothetical protein [Deltaproteobacteria bacterium]MBW2124255.1 hypothetical protein [Deltaproteobacteria bacterium]
MSYAVASLLFIASFFVGVFAGGMIMREIMNRNFRREIRKYRKVVHLGRRV